MDVDSGDGPVVNLLWTGGWDSTFRLLQLILDTRATIQPVYVIDTARRSSLIEIRTMDRIKRKIVKRFPHAEGRILPHRFFSIHDIAEDATITESYLRLARRWHLGSQYDWLPRLAKQHGFCALEMSVVADSRPRGGIVQCLSDRVISVDDAQVGRCWTIDADPNVSDASNVFSRFRFPLLHTTKVQMYEQMERRGCSDILMQTWFCLAPVGGQPCGVCNPCQLVVEEGLWQRLPRAALFRYRCLCLRRLPRRTAKRILRFLKGNGLPH